jgi:glycosyltransferase involved in cell wall biosynthesis
MINKNSVFISVLVPVFNQELFIGRCLRSLLYQSLNRENFEIIVINDGCTDNTKLVLNSFKSEIFLLNNHKNMGLPYCLNKGIKAARGRFVVRVDSDDYVNYEFLNFLQMYLVYNTDIDAVSSDYYLVDDNENILKRMNSTKDPIGCAIMFRIKNLIEIGMYDQNFLLHEDKDLRIRFLKKFNIHNIRLPLYRYRQHSNNITKNSISMKKHYKKLLKKHKNL